MLSRTLWGAWLAFTAEVGAGTIILSPVADTFLSEFSPDHNTGGHTNVAAGSVSNGTRTRALLRFDIAANVPAGATITNVALRLQVTRVIMGGGVHSSFDLRRTLTPWNEGAQTGNLGAPAGPGEATWNHRRAPDVPWNAPGGAMGLDFAAAVCFA